MRKLNLEQIEVGSKLARSIYNSKSQMLLGRGTILTIQFLERLKGLGYTSVYIDDGLIDDIAVDEVISEETRLQAVSCLKEIGEDIQKNKTFSVALAKQVVSRLIDDLITNREMMLSLSDIRSYDDYTFNHSVNVTVISAMIGMSLHYNQIKLHDLSLGVLLHDIGKIQTPLEIINKPGRLTAEEYNVVKQHTWHGFELLRNNPEIKITSAHIALQHHERCDGSGYPRNLQMDEILEFARISAIADVFDALTNDRCYRKKIPVHQAYDILMENSGSHFDNYILDRFIQKIALFPQGTKVRLNDGRSGLVIRQNNTCPTRPVIRLFWQLGRELIKPVEVNLLDEPNLAIVEALSS